MRVVITCLIAIIALFALSGYERVILNYKMEQLCKKDGGITVYERVTLPASEFRDLTGQPLWRYWIAEIPLDGRLGPKYRYVSDRTVLIGKDARDGSGDGQLARLYWAVYRRSDNRLLGEQVEYRRSGGDFFTFGFQSSSSFCPRVDTGVTKLVFIKGN